jgi:uncharacterized protein (TIGR04255 family)
MGRKMKNAPVYFSIAQVRFNTLMALDSYAPGIQDRMRKAGFPDAKKDALTTFNLNLAGNEVVSQVPAAQVARYVFANMDRTAAFLLDAGALSFQTTEYDVFPTFSATFLKGLETVHDAVGLSYSDRTGLRYLDAVYPKVGETLHDYLSASVLGLVGKLEGTLVHSFSETVTATAAAKVVSRTIVQLGAVGFPPDLFPMELKVPERFRTLNGLHAIVDTDGAHEQRESLDINNIKDRLGAIHDEIDKSFRVTVTEQALRTWE